MEHDEIGGDGATEAFDGLRGEIALMRRAVERLAAEKADAPDYTVTLGKISRDQRQAAERLEAMANSPALSLTPVAIGTQVERVAADLRRADRQTIDGVRRELAEATKTITERVSSARSGERQSYWLAAASVSGFIAGLLFLILLGGPIARTFPARWHFPGESWRGRWEPRCGRLAVNLWRRVIIRHGKRSLLLNRC